jgi:hypothetical protein
MVALPLLRGRVRAFMKLTSEASAGDSELPPEYRARRRAEQKLDTWFPRTLDKVLPTRLGNAVRAWEDYARTRWSLETVVVWPRVEMLLTEQEGKVHADAQTDFAFFVNSSVVSALVGVALALDELVNHRVEPWLAWVYVAPFGLSYLFYRWSLRNAVRWGETIRASIDLHREELYKAFGVAMPSTAAETSQVGIAINRFLLYGDPLPGQARPKGQRTD